MHWLCDCAHGQTHIGNVSSAPHLLSFSSSLPFNATMRHFISLSMLDFHTIAVTKCVNWEKCVNKWLIFLPFLLYFYFAPHRLVIRTTNFWLTRYHHINKFANVLCQKQQRGWQKEGESEAKSILCGHKKKHGEGDFISIHSNFFTDWNFIHDK